MRIAPVSNIRPSGRAPRGARVALMLAGVVALAGCTTVKGWFGGKAGNALKPAELTDFAATAKAERLWALDLGDGEGALGARQGPVVADGRVYTIDTAGTVRAFNASSGDQLWSARFGDIGNNSGAV